MSIIPAHPLPGHSGAFRGTCTEHRPAAVLNGGGIPDADATVGIAREDGLVDGWMDGLVDGWMDGWISTSNINTEKNQDM